ncbi:hypothetical protein GCM10010339_06140 [Streptomyces alanosinicus]|uniref:Uncharacterized protein n=1 Tax=Streptomyces alanosinicus TaxID=68171 RepID=A0A919CZU8_9ACTN|nr:hypothetical protein GCM10010339_06140 [Streptomyces alanosinicus]
MMATHHDGKLTRHPPTQPEPISHPLLQQQLPSQPMRRHPPLLAVLTGKRHIKPRVSHRHGQRLNLTSEGRARLPHVMDPGQKLNELTSVSISAG